MTRGILSACHVRPTRPVTQAELDALYLDAYGDEPFVHGRRRAAGDEARPGLERGPGLVPRGRAERPDPRDRRPRQPRQGRRGPGDPGVQRRPRPARDGRPAPAPARARSARRRPTRSRRRIDVPRDRPAPRAAPRRRGPRSSASRGSRPGSRPRARRRASRRPATPDLALVVASDGPVPAAAVTTPNRSRPRPSGCPGRTSGDRRHGRRGGVRARRHRDVRAPRTPRPVPRATPTRPRSARPSRRPSAARPPRSSTSRRASSARGCRVDLVATPLPASRRRARRDRRRARGSRRGAADHRLHDEDRDGDASRRPAPTAATVTITVTASRRASA